MRAVIRFGPAEIRPQRSDVYRRLGMSPTDGVTGRIEDLVQSTEDLFERLAEPVALFEEVSVDDFRDIYEGAGTNAAASPLDEIYPRADALALFAATLGSALDESIRDLFQRGDPAVGFVLDVTSAGAADRLPYLIVRRFLGALARNGRHSSHTRGLAYSPGYCGWHVSGQRALFDRLSPQRIGITLTASCQMDPIKSVSGVLVSGRREIHRFRPTYPFCDTCATHDCRDRMKTVMRPRG